MQWSSEMSLIVTPISSSELYDKTEGGRGGGSGDGTDDEKRC
jgi:hypothetical protein